MESQTIGLVVQAVGTTGVLHQLTGVIAQHQGDITSVEILVNRPEEARTPGCRAPKRWCWLDR